ncbi:putative transmembrane ascorbate ferrireductase 4 [Acorus calamus]|uniref:Transmembrane ascorbate ferrireductase 4 n=1 Tax=Acorus calamus TaxID=4465 RepID=A0AAV9DAH0_ACOCL|nr:putative transmembrane ascorbate ferrireductase 4 [Acorus calamus]
MALTLMKPFLPSLSTINKSSSFPIKHSWRLWSSPGLSLSAPVVIGFILVSGEAIMVHRSLSGWSRRTRKSVHLGLQGAALGLGLFFGIWAKFKGRDGIFANFYSLHSWLGLLCLSLFAAELTWFVINAYRITGFSMTSSD